MRLCLTQLLLVLMLRLQWMSLHPCLICIIYISADMLH